MHAQELKKPLRVTFIGAEGVAEEGLDEGGVSREFFQLLVSFNSQMPTAAVLSQPPVWWWQVSEL